MILNDSSYHHHYIIIEIRNNPTSAIIGYILSTENSWCRNVSFITKLPKWASEQCYLCHCYVFTLLLIFLENFFLIKNQLVLVGIINLRCYLAFTGWKNSAPTSQLWPSTKLHPIRTEGIKKWAVQNHNFKQIPQITHNNKVKKEKWHRKMQDRLEKRDRISSSYNLYIVQGLVFKAPWLKYNHLITKNLLHFGTVYSCILYIYHILPDEGEALCALFHKSHAFCCLLSHWLAL